MWTDTTTLPPSWRFAPLRTVASPTRQWRPASEPRETIRYVDVSAISRELARIESSELLRAEDAPSRARKILEKDDVLYATVRPTLRRIALVDDADEMLIGSTAFCVVRADSEKAFPRFLYYAMRSDPFNKEVALHESGASYPAVRDHHVLDATIPLPPLKEQHRIAAILSKVQRAIEVQEQLVATVRDLKQAAMRELFTRGLRGEAQKETDYGSIPASWRTSPLGSCATVQTGVTKGRQIPPDQAIVVPYLRVANVQDGHLDLREMKSITIRRDELGSYLLRDGDVVLTEGGDFDKLGRGFIWRGEVQDCVHQNHVFAVRADRSQLLPEFLAYLVQSPYGRAYFLTVAHKTTNLACINSTKLKALPVPLPGLTEQQDIASALHTIDRKLAHHERKRDTLQDLFKTLLHELMTGRIRVHELELDITEPTAGLTGGEAA